MYALVFLGSDVWHIAPVVDTILLLWGDRGIEYAWSAGPIENENQIVEVARGRWVVHHLRRSAGDYDCDKDNRPYN